MDKEILRKQQAERRKFDKEMGERFDNERVADECFTEFKERKTKELGIRYHSWERIPGEPLPDFKKRLSGVTL